MSWRRLQHALIVTIFCLPSKTSWKRFKEVLQIALEDTMKKSWRRLERCKIVTLQTSPRRLKDMSWRRLEDVLETNKIFIGNVYLTNLNAYLTNLYFTTLYLTNLTRIQNALIRTNSFDIRLILKHKRHFYFKD